MIRNSQLNALGGEFAHPKNLAQALSLETRMEGPMMLRAWPLARADLFDAGLQE